MTAYQAGIQLLRKMLGTERAESVIQKFRSLSPVFENEAVSVVFGRTWSRETIDLKTRSLCSIAILASLGRLNALRINFTLAMEMAPAWMGLWRCCFRLEFMPATLPHWTPSCR